jgi:hypothetical protein
VAREGGEILSIKEAICRKHDLRLVSVIDHLTNALFKKIGIVVDPLHFDV